MALRSFNLVTGQFTPPKAKKSGGARAKTPTGCEYCHLHTLKQVHRVLGLSRIEGRRAMLWAQSPGQTENARGLELVGKVGQFLWQTLKPYGLSRRNFDIQNVVRCWPADTNNTPTPEEVHCCSVYNDRALDKNQGKAQVHVVLGKIAGAQLFGRGLNKDTPVFWYDPWQAYVVCNDHPSFIVRSGGTKAGWLYEEFQTRFRAVVAILEHPGRWGYVLAQPYFRAESYQEVDACLRRAEEEDIAGLDMETGVVNEQEVMLMASVSWGNYRDRKDWRSWEGEAHAIVLDHPESQVGKAERRAIRERLGVYVENHRARKLMQHGSFDERKFGELCHWKLRGYEDDSHYTAYLHRPNLRSYSLHNLAQRCFPEFADYKLMMAEYSGNYAKAPLERISPYACADADLSLRIYRQSSRKRTQPLAKVYTRAAVTLEKMETRGPILDYPALERVDKVVPKQIEELAEKLRIQSGEPDFNPNTPADLAVLMFDKLQLPEVNGRSTAKGVLQTLIETTGHDTPKDIQNYRFLTKAKSTYLDGYRRSAELHGGELRTHWNLTITATSRLSSGGDEAGEGGIINFQNLHGNPLFKNLLVADKDWRAALDAACNIERLLDTYVFLAFDYSQVEIRILAETTQDPLLIRQFNSGADIHCLVGHELTGWPVEKIAKDKEVRRLVKNLHFGIVYGISEAGLEAYLIAKGVKPALAKKAPRFLRAYFNRYRVVAKWIERQRAFVEKHGFVENIFGFRRPIGAWDTSRSTYWGNQAINTPIQGGAHTLMLILLALLDMKPRTYNLLQLPLMEVHDAMYFRVRLRHLAEAYRQGLALMQENVVQYVADAFGRNLSVPLVAEGEAGFCLGSMVEYAAQPTGRFLQEWRKKHVDVEKSAWEKLLPEAA